MNIACNLCIEKVLCKIRAWKCFFQDWIHSTYKGTNWRSQVTKGQDGQYIWISTDNTHVCQGCHLLLKELKSGHSSYKTCEWLLVSTWYFHWCATFFLQVPQWIHVPKDMAASTYVLKMGAHTPASVEPDMCWTWIRKPVHVRLHFVWGGTVNSVMQLARCGSVFFQVQIHVGRDMTVSIFVSTMAIRTAANVEWDMS